MSPRDYRVGTFLDGQSAVSGLASDQSLGVYDVMAYSVAQRRQEVGQSWTASAREV